MRLLRPDDMLPWRDIKINYYFKPWADQGNTSNSFLSVKCSGVMALLILAHKSQFSVSLSNSIHDGIGHSRSIDTFESKHATKQGFFFLSKEPFYLHTTEGRSYFPFHSQI